MVLHITPNICYLLETRVRLYTEAYGRETTTMSVVALNNIKRETDETLDIFDERFNKVVGKVDDQVRE